MLQQIIKQLLYNINLNPNKYYYTRWGNRIEQLIFKSTKRKFILLPVN